MINIAVIYFIVCGVVLNILVQTNPRLTKYRNKRWVITIFGWLIILYSTVNIIMRLIKRDK